MVLSAMSPNSRAGNAAAASCTHHCPSAKPGSMVTDPCSSVRTVPVGSVSPCSRVAHCAASDFTVRSSDGSWLSAIAISPGGGFAVMRGPARHQPWRHVQRLRLDLVDQRLALARAAAQHRVDEAGIFRGAPVRLHQPHRQIDRGMIGHVHPEDLRRADQQRALRARRVGRNAAVEQPRQHMAQRSQPPQNGRHQPPHQRAVAVGQGFQSGMGAGASSWSSRVRRLCSTPSRMSAAIRRAARPGTSVGGANRNGGMKVLIAFETGGNRRRPSMRKTPMPREYAKCKNRPGNFVDRKRIYALTFVLRTSRSDDWIFCDDRGSR